MSSFIEPNQRSFGLFKFEISNLERVSSMKRKIGNSHYTFSIVFLGRFIENYSFVRCINGDTES